MKWAGVRSLFVAGAFAIASAPGAQVSVAPESLRVTLQRGEETAMTLVVANGGSSTIVFCLDFDRPLQRETTPRLGAGCGEPGEILATFETADYPGSGSFNPHSLAMTPLGHLLVSELSDVTYQFTYDLQYVRRFLHPVVNELDVAPLTVGVTYDAHRLSLWWMNEEAQGQTLLRYLLLEGSLDGVATGRRIELPRVPAPPEHGIPYAFFRGANYSSATGRFYYLDAINHQLRAIDTTGVAPPGYPLSLEAFPPPPDPINVALGPSDTHGEGSGPASERIELRVIEGDFPSETYRVVITDPLGRDLGLPATPLDEVRAIPGPAVPQAILRSRLDPNGVMYVTYAAFSVQGIAAIRPQPLAPSWLSLSQWMGTVSAGGSAALTLTFNAGDRSPGEYRSTLVVEDTAGVVLASVPLTMVVTPDTPAEPGPGRARAWLTVSPNPARGAAVVTLTLPAATPAARVVVFDVLGREVEGLHDGPLSAGATRLILPLLPAGVYVARAAVAGAAPAAARFVVAR